MFFIRNLVLLAIITVVFASFSNILDNKTTPGASLENTCDKEVNVPEKKKCWEELISNALKKHGLNDAFVVLDYLYKSEPMFAQGCHDYTHLIGEAAYDLFAAGVEIELSDKTSYCGFGYYHGFMDTLLVKSGGLAFARKFCNDVEQINKGSWYNCYHGIGHGVTDGSDPSKWGDEHAMMAGGLNLCEKVGENDKAKTLCATGVFNALAFMYGEPKYDLNYDPNNPYRACFNLKDQYQHFKSSCFTILGLTLFAASDGDFLKAAKFVEKIGNDEYATSAMYGLAHYPARLNFQGDYMGFVENCHLLQDRLQIECIKGYARGLMLRGMPEEEWVKPIAFCQSEKLSDIERVECLNEVLKMTDRYYAAEKQLFVCNQVEGKNSKYCKM